MEAASLMTATHAASASPAPHLTLVSGVCIYEALLSCAVNLTATKKWRANHAGTNEEPFISLYGGDCRQH
jgi:hypothetical protein